MKKMLGLVAATALFASSGVASAAGMVTSFTVEKLSSLLTAWGAGNVTAAKTPDGQRDLVRFDSGGTTYTALLSACPKEQAGCVGLYVGVGIQGSSGAITLQTVNDFNSVLPFGKAVRTQDGTAAILFRYIVADGGITEENLRTNIGVLTQMPEAFNKHLASATVASLPGSNRGAQVSFQTWAPSAAHSEALQRATEAVLQASALRSGR
ncbi:MAG: YbjN domain-containing protein [Alphaproteobacteria bacterium]|nr:YbjN domain-containing protein [Alphaproteobacteria bacterium]